MIGRKRTVSIILSTLLSLYLFFLSLQEKKAGDKKTKDSNTNKVIHTVLYHPKKYNLMKDIIHVNYQRFVQPRVIRGICPFYFKTGDDI